MIDSNIMKRRRDGSSPLDVVRSSYGRLAREVIALPPEIVSGLGTHELAVGRLLDLLLDPGVPIATVDAVWVWLVRRSRTHGGDATMVCAGMALPVLAATSARLSYRWAGDLADIEAAVLCGFLAELARIDLTRPWVLHRLRWAAYRSGYACMRERQNAPVPSTWVDAPENDDPTQRTHRPMRSPHGHPDLVLAHAVEAGVITSAQAQLIASTRLERHSLTVLAAERGVSYKALHQVRRRAEHKLAAYLRERMRDRDPGATSEIAARAVGSPAPTQAPKDRPHRPDRGDSGVAPIARLVSKPDPRSGVQVCRDTPAPAHPSPEVRRCA
ncbi:hypothetical protein OG203_30970 [Nocardia sp. NBC_01499]|uniref:hypothetical protein n=1 Tax=Nocardia sp. NBC_01499 TaxID=2903597 RepID=UPI00386D0D50